MIERLRNSSVALSRNVGLTSDGELSLLCSYYDHFRGSPLYLRNPAVRLRKAHDLLRPGGWVALWWNVSSEDNDTPVDDALARAYAAHAPEVGGLPSINDADPDGWPGVATGLDFGPPHERDFPWTQAYTTSEWLELLRTHSNHRLLAPDRLEALLAAVADAIDDHGGVYHHRYVCQLWSTQRLR